MTAEAPQTEQLAPEELVKRDFPVKSGEFRKIHVIVEGQRYRVNFHDVDTNIVRRSFFVTVQDGKTRVGV
jgi:hypothetical protein